MLPSQALIHACGQESTVMRPPCAGDCNDEIISAVGETFYFVVY